MPRLALTRRVGERIAIGSPANPMGHMTVVAIRGDKTRLMFEFPQEVEINREELAAEKATADA